MNSNMAIVGSVSQHPSTSKKRKKTRLSWSSLYLVTFLAAYLYVFNEWLFTVTKPSCMSHLGFIQELNIFFTVSALMTGICFLCILFLVLPGFIPNLKRYTGILIKLGGFLPALIFAALILIMVDNFTYTVFKFGIVSTAGWLRGLYGLLFILMVVLCYWRILKVLAALSRNIRIWKLSPKWVFGTLLGVLLLSIVALAFSKHSGNLSPSINNTASSEQRPNIILITSDSVNASHMSLYGYARDTTPHLRDLAESALVGENAFSNSGFTTGSIISIYTGKYPAQTRVLFPPDILRDDDSYEHLPGILRSQGYKTVQIAVPHYLDANDLDLLDGFDSVRTSNAGYSKYLSIISKFLPNESALFTGATIDRIADRARHIFFIKKMSNPYLLVTRMADALDDSDRLETLQQEIQTSQQPVFIHVHLMVTHGETYNPSEQKFSAGQSVESQEPWSVDFYDDSILNFDRNIGELVAYLTDRDLLDNTILIVGSDHGQQWNQLSRLPLIMRFPNGQYAGRIQVNVQNLDIAPTILDYLGLDQPQWMDGESLISGELEQRPIIGVKNFKDEPDSNNIWSVNWDDLTAPFYQFSSVSLIHCQKWFELDLTSLNWQTGNVEGSTTACLVQNEITDEQAYQLIVEHLRENGFDVTSLDAIRVAWSD